MSRLPVFFRQALLVATLLTGANANASDLRISLPILPGVADADNVWLQLAKAIAREWKEGKAVILPPVPFERSIAAVAEGHADVHFPLMSSPARSEDDLPFKYSYFTLSESPFAIYTKVGNERFDPGQLTIAALSKLRIETEKAHAPLFFGRFREADSIEGALRRVASGQIDAFLFAARPTERVLKKLKLDNIQRTPYRRMQDKMVLPKGAVGDDLEEKLGLIIDRMKDRGEFQRILAPLKDTR